MQDLDKKTILVTGTSKGIGSAIARALGAAGANVIAHYGNDRAGAERATAAIPNERKMLLTSDFADLDSVEALWDAGIAWRGSIDVLVNNAAMLAWNGGIDQPVEVWDQVWQNTLRVNVEAPARLLRRAVKHFLDTGGGSIITVSSWAAQRGISNPDAIAYGSSKAAIHNATQTIARAHAADGVLAYVIAPGVVRTRLSDQAAATLGGEQQVTDSLAMREWVPPEEIASLTAFLASGKARHLTGATLDFNGASYIR